MDAEEGELSDQEVELGERFPVERPKVTFDLSSVEGANGRRAAGRPYESAGAFGGLKITLSNDLNPKMNLPDLVNDSMINKIDRSVTEKMEARAKRFNFNKQTTAKFDDIVELYDSLGIPKSEQDGAIELTSATKFVLKAVHVRGIPRGKVSEDIYEYFKEFNPISYEWIDSTSANVLWATPNGAARALINLSRPLIVRDDLTDDSNGHSVEDEEMEGLNQRDADEDGEGRMAERKLKSSKKLLTVQEILARFEEGPNKPFYSDELTADIGDVPSTAGGVWRVGKPTEKLNNVLIYMRIAGKSDCGAIDDRQLFTLNKKLREEGGILSGSRKRKLTEMVTVDRERAEAEAAAKRYSGPVGKNPWGTIAEEWTGKPKGGDFADELRMFARQRGTTSALKGVPGMSAKDRLGPRATAPTVEVNRPTLEVKRVLVDWDAPEDRDTLDLERDVGIVEPIRQKIEARRNYEDEDEESERGETLIEEDDEVKWDEKLRRPRGGMVADEVESRQSAKDRLYNRSNEKKPIRIMRRIANKPRMHIEEEEYYEDEEEVEDDLEKEKPNEPVIKDLRFTIRKDVDDVRKEAPPQSGVGISDRFAKISTRVQDRLGDREDREDSLERETAGFDLRKGLKEMKAQQMLIQVDNEPAVAETEKEKPHPAVKKTSTIAEKAAKYSEAKLKRRSDEGKKDSKAGIKEDVRRRQERDRAAGSSATNGRSASRRDKENSENITEERRVRRAKVDEVKDKEVRKAKIDEKDKTARRKDEVQRKEVKKTSPGTSSSKSKLVSVSAKKKAALPANAKKKGSSASTKKRYDSSSDSSSSDSSSDSSDSSSDSDSSDSDSSSDSSSSSSDSEAERKKRMKKRVPMAGRKTPASASASSSRAKLVSKGGGVDKKGRRPEVYKERATSSKTTTSSSSKAKSSSSSTKERDRKSSSSKDNRDKDDSKAKRQEAKSKLSDYLKKAKARKDKK